MNRSPSRKDIRFRSILRLEPLERRDVPAVFIVDSTDDTIAADGVVTLREAIDQANIQAGDDTISFAEGLTASGPATIKLLSALPDLLTNITINGPAANKLTVMRSDAGGTPDFGVFTVSSMATASISGVTIRNGKSTADGGGILNGGTLTLSGVAIVGNNAAGFGGGVENAGGKLTMVNSTVSGNTASGSGGIDTYNNGTLTLFGVTVSGNSATGNVGGVNSDSSFTTLIACTVTNNHAGGTSGGMLTGGGDVALRNTIVAGNTRGVTNIADNIQGTLNATRSHFNLIGSAGFGGLVNGQNGNRVGIADPGLLPLAFNGGPVQTHALKASSPARDAGTAFLSAIAFGLDASTTFFNVIDAGYLAAGAVIRVDDEEMLIQTVFGNSISVVRGVNGTTPIFHLQGAGISAARDARGLLRTKDFAGIANALGSDATDIGAYEPQARVLGIGGGGQPIVKLYEADTQTEKLAINPFGVADPNGTPFVVADFNGDGIPDLAAARAGVVRVFDGTNGAQIKELQPFGATYKGSVALAGSDFDGDGYAELVAGTGAGAQANVRVFSGQNWAQLWQFQPFPRFFGGVTLAADAGRIIVGTASQTSKVAVYNWSTQTKAGEIAAFVFGSAGVNVAAGDVNGDGISDILVSGASGANRRVMLYRADTRAAIGQVMWTGPIGSGLRVAATDLNGDGILDILVAQGRYSQPLIRGYSGTTLLEIAGWQPFGNNFLGGVLVG